MDALSAFLMADEPTDPALSHRSADEAPAPVLGVPVEAGQFAEGGIDPAMLPLAASRPPPPSSLSSRQPAVPRELLGEGLTSHGGVSKRVWTREEDNQLLQLVTRYGPQAWASIAERLPGRVGKQCRERWHNHVDPKINKEEWTEAEDQRLAEIVETIGTKWAQIAQMMPGRTDNAIKNRWNSRIRRMLRQQSDGAVERSQSVPAVVRSRSLNDTSLQRLALGGGVRASPYTKRPPRAPSRAAPPLAPPPPEELLEPAKLAQHQADVIQQQQTVIEQQTAAIKAQQLVIEQQQQAERLLRPPRAPSARRPGVESTPACRATASVPTRARAGKSTLPGMLQSMTLDGPHASPITKRPPRSVARPIKLAASTQLAPPVEAKPQAQEELIELSTLLELCGDANPQLKGDSPQGLHMPLEVSAGSSPPEVQAAWGPPPPPHQQEEILPDLPAAASMPNDDWVESCLAGNEGYSAQAEGGGEEDLLQAELQAALAMLEDNEDGAQDEFMDACIAELSSRDD